MGDKTCLGCRKRVVEVKLGFMPRSLCGKCFCRTVEKRIRRYIRLKYPFKKEDTLTILDDNSLDAKVLIFAMENLQKDFPFKLRIVKSAPCKGKVAVPWNLDDSAASFVESVVFKTAFKMPLAPLSVIHPDEIRIFSKIKGIKGPAGKRLSIRGKKVLEGLNKMEEKHPDIKFSILNFLSEINP